jgi:hypothetical protein
LLFWGALERPAGGWILPVVFAVLALLPTAFGLLALRAMFAALADRGVRAS